MNGGAKKNNATNNSKKQLVLNELKSEENTSLKNSDEAREVDDKLIGDDLDISEAEGGYEDRETRLEGDENNY